MLVLSRKVNESIVIDGRIIVKVVRFDGETVKLGIQAPLDVPVHRHEVYLEIQKNNQEALASGRLIVPRLRASHGPRKEQVTPRPPDSTPPDPPPGPPSDESSSP